MAEKILVTGGCGFIGSRLTRRLVKEGHEVVVLDNLSRSTTEPIADLIAQKKVTFIDGDIRYADAVSKAMAGCTIVYHEAATCINRSVAYPMETTEINFVGTQNVIEEARRQGVKRFIFASSASVYGNPKKLPMSEGDEMNPITPYCVTKLAGEHLLQYYHFKYGLPFVSLRYFNVYGPGQKTDAYYTSVIIAFIKRILNGESPVIDGDGSQSMDFIHVDDIVEANVKALTTTHVNEAYNVGTGKSTTVKELAEILLKSLDSPLEPQFSGRKSIVSQRRADVSKAKDKLGFTAHVKVMDGMLQTARDIRAAIQSGKY